MSGQPLLKSVLISIVKYVLQNDTSLPKQLVEELLAESDVQADGPPDFFPNYNIYPSQPYYLYIANYIYLARERGKFHPLPSISVSKLDSLLPQGPAHAASWPWSNSIVPIDNIISLVDQISDEMEISYSFREHSGSSANSFGCIGLGPLASFFFGVGKGNNGSSCSSASGVGSQQQDQDGFIVNSATQTSSRMSLTCRLAPVTTQPGTIANSNLVTVTIPRNILFECSDLICRQVGYHGILSCIGIPHLKGSLSLRLLPHSDNLSVNDWKISVKDNGEVFAGSDIVGCPWFLVPARGLLEDTFQRYHTPTPGCSLVYPSTLEGSGTMDTTTAKRHTGSILTVGARALCKHAVRHSDDSLSFWTSAIGLHAANRPASPDVSISQASTSVPGGAPSCNVATSVDGQIGEQLLSNGLTAVTGRTSPITGLSVVELQSTSANDASSSSPTEEKHNKENDENCENNRKGSGGTAKGITGSEASKNRTAWLKLQYILDHCAWVHVHILSSTTSTKSGSTNCAVPQVVMDTRRRVAVVEVRVSTGQGARWWFDIDPSKSTTNVDISDFNFEVVDNPLNNISFRGFLEPLSAYDNE